MSNAQWVLKRKHYAGGDSIITRYSVKADAEDDRDLLNNGYQSAQYYVEAFDNDKAGGYTNTNIHSNAELLRKCG